MDGDDELMAKVYHKIEREKALIAAATNMRQSTDNPLVQQRVDANIRDGRKNIAYLEEKMRELQVRKMGRESGHQPGSPNQQRHSEGGPPPPPKDGGRYSSEMGYTQEGTGPMPSGAPFHDPRPGGPIPKARPNFSKLGRFTSNSPWNTIIPAGGSFLGRS